MNVLEFLYEDSGNGNGILKFNEKNFLSLTHCEWDRKTPVCMPNGLTFFFSEVEVKNHMMKYPSPVDEIYLLICKDGQPTNLRTNYKFLG